MGKCVVIISSNGFHVKVLIGLWSQMFMPYFPCLTHRLTYLLANISKCKWVLIIDWKNIDPNIDTWGTHWIHVQFFESQWQPNNTNISLSCWESSHSPWWYRVCIIYLLCILCFSGYSGHTVLWFEMWGMRQRDSEREITGDVWWSYQSARLSSSSDLNHSVCLLSPLWTAGLKC